MPRRFAKAAAPVVLHAVVIVALRGFSQQQPKGSADVSMASLSRSKGALQRIRKLDEQ